MTFFAIVYVGLPVGVGWHVPLVGIEGRGGYKDIPDQHQPDESKKEGKGRVYCRFMYTSHYLWQLKAAVSSPCRHSAFVSKQFVPQMCSESTPFSFVVDICEMLSSRLVCEQ